MDLRYKAACTVTAPAGMPATDIEHKIMQLAYESPRFKVRGVEGLVIDDEQPSSATDGERVYSATVTIDIPEGTSWEDMRCGVGELLAKVADPLTASVLRIDERPDDIDRIVAAHERHALDPSIGEFDASLQVKQTVSFLWYRMADGQTKVPATAEGVFLTKVHGAVPLPAPGDTVTLFWTHVRVVDRHISYATFTDTDGERLTEVEVDVYVDVLPPRSGVQGKA